MEQITVFRASDGEFFDTPEDCEDYERLNCGQYTIDDYLESDFNPYIEKPSYSTTSMSKKIINGWEQYKKSKKEEPDITTDFSLKKGPVKNSYQLPPDTIFVPDNIT